MRIALSIICCVIIFSSCKEDKGLNHQVSSMEKTSIASVIDNPSQDYSQLPRLFSNNEELYFSWVTRKDSTDFLNFSVLKDSTWSTVSEVASGNDWFTNWADFPVIAENNGNILTSFLQKSATGTYTYDVKLNVFSSESTSWKKNFILHDDGTKSEHGFVSMIPFGDSFFVSWLDGRNTAGGHDSHDEHGDGGAMTLRGAFVGADGEIKESTELDAKVCDCCQTSVTKTPNHIIVAYRDRSDDEVRDISIVRHTTHLGWSVPKVVVKDNWEIAGCPVNGPSIDAFENSVALAWFTAKNEKPKVQVVFSEDGGETFGIPIRVDTNDTLGRVDVVMLDTESAAVVWMEMIGEETLIQLIKVNSNGSRGEIVTVSKTDSSRASGFPQLEKVGDTLFLAWTMLQEEGAGTAILTAKVRIDQM
jgi:hypothetical protein